MLFARNMSEILERLGSINEQLCDEVETVGEFSNVGDMVSRWM